MKIKYTLCLVMLLLLAIAVCACTDVSADIPKHPADAPQSSEEGQSSAEPDSEGEATETDRQGTPLIPATTNDGENTETEASTSGGGGSVSETGGVESGTDPRYWETFWDNLPKPSDGTKPY